MKLQNKAFVAEFQGAFSTNRNSWSPSQIFYICYP